MSSAGDLFIRLKHITSLGSSDLNGDDVTAQMDLGTVSIVNDRLGYRIFRYFRNDSGSNFIKGECMSRAVNTAVANILSGTTTSATTTSLTADAFDGKLAVVTSNADSAGAAPETEVSVIDNNTTTVISFDPQYAFSVALAVNDDLEVISTFQAVQSATSDLAVEGLGAVMSVNGMTDGRFGWGLVEGNGVVGSSSAVAFTELLGLSAGAGLLAGSAASLTLTWGYALASAAASHSLSPVHLNLFTANGLGSA